jgi:hypothetical protein
MITPTVMLATLMQALDATGANVAPAASRYS